MKSFSFFIIFFLVFIFKELQKAAEEVDLQRIGEFTNLLNEAKETVADDFQGPVRARSVEPDAILPKFSTSPRSSQNLSKM